MDAQDLQYYGGRNQLADLADSPVHVSSKATEEKQITKIMDKSNSKVLQEVNEEDDMYSEIDTNNLNTKIKTPPSILRGLL